MRIKVFIVGLAFSLSFIGQLIGQGYQVTGRVISGENREPLIGVNISVKGTSLGTITDSDGRYELNVPSPQEVLIFSYIGYRMEEISIDGRKVVDVVMAPQAIAGEDVVVIGYGTQQRKDVTSSISSLKESGFTQGTNTDLQSLLQARVPGVVVTSSNGDIGGEPLIRIRGGTSITASNNPMIVVDGVPIDNSSSLPEGVEYNGTRDNPLGMINPNDIASIDILKDASAAAIYGARGGNGVILITTKEGRADGKVSLTYNGYTSSSTVSKKLDLMTAKQYLDYADSLVTKIGDRDDDGFPDYTGPDNGGASTDWQDAVLRTARTQNHNISFSAGTPQTQYRVSLDYLDEQGIVLNSERKRYSARLNIRHKMLNDKLRLGLKVNPTFIKRNNTPYNQRAGYYGGVFTNVFKMNPTYPVYDSTGAYFEYPTTTIRNPVALLKEITDVSEDLRILFNATAEYEFMKGLSAKVNLGLDRSATTRSSYEPNSLPYAAAIGGRASVRENARQAVLFEPTLNYKLNMGESQLEAWAGYSFQEFTNSGFGTIAKDFVTDAWLYNNLGGGADFTDRPYSFKNANRLVSFLGRVNYNMAGKYLLSAALRREGSSRFGADRKWGLFPSVSLGWRLSEESFMQGIDILSDLKARLSYGVTGNQDIGNYRSLVVLGPGSNAVIGGQMLTGVSATQLANPDLQWETTTQSNFGVDFALLENRISGSVDLYKKTTRDLLLEFDVPQPAVVSTRLDNVGEVENKGIEFALSTVNISTDDFFWRTNFNFASNKNKVVSLGPDKDKYIITGDVGGAGLSGVQAQIIISGEQMGTFFGYKFYGFDSTGQEILIDPNVAGADTLGPLKDGRHILGYAQPKFTFGISNTMTYKKIDFSFFIQGVQGNKILNNTRLEYQRPSNPTNNINLFAETKDDVDNGLDPLAAVAYSDRFIEDGSFIRLQNLTVGYTFDTAQFKNLRLYLSADNLFILTKYKGYDPEVNTFTGYALGIDYTNYPKARTFTLGISVGL